MLRGRVAWGFRIKQGFSEGCLEARMLREWDAQGLGWGRELGLMGAWGSGCRRSVQGSGCRRELGVLGGGSGCRRGAQELGCSREGCLGEWAQKWGCDAGGVHYREGKCLGIGIQEKAWRQVYRRDGWTKGWDAKGDVQDAGGEPQSDAG